MNALILCVGSLKERYFTDACREYLKRLTRYGSFELREVPDLRIADKSGAPGSDGLTSAEREVVRREGEELLRQIRRDDYVVALAIKGRELSSQELSDMCLKWRMNGRRTVFVIGGSLGLSPEVLARADYQLSFSRMTFPHQLMRVVLLEQVYRAMTILSGEKYHK
ncbi:MAG: 23S rRNA (pseudouridine(1915)-N(3))-methyltransferase RlmH [Candidatus Fimadaptatus sp.]